MPRRFERHKRAKSGWDSWETAPPRSSEVRAAVAADPEPAKRPPGRKDTRRWCKGKPGVAHALVLVLTTDAVTCRPVECKWRTHWGADGTVKWSCGHREVCAQCGKVFRESWDLAKDGCPAYPGSLEQKHYAEAEAAEWAQRFAARRFFRRPAITGPQHYRRSRAG